MAAGHLQKYGHGKDDNHDVLLARVARIQHSLIENSKIPPKITNQDKNSLLAHEGTKNIFQKHLANKSYGR